MGELILRRANGDALPTSPESPSDPDLRRDPRVLKFIRDARSEETRRKYRWAIEEWLDFCSHTGRAYLDAPPTTLEAFAAYLAEKPVKKGKNAGRVGYAPQTISMFLSAVRTFHRAQAANPPDRRLAAEVIRGHAAQRAADPTFTDGEGAPALSLPTFRQLVAACPTDTTAGIRDRAVLCGGMGLMARRRALVGLDVEHLRPVEEGLEVTILRDKRQAKPRRVTLPHWPNLPDLDGARWMLAWREQLAAAGITGGPLFRAVDKGGNIHGAGTWAGRAGLNPRMDPGSVEDIIQRAAIAAALAEWEQMTGHLLRKTGATLAYKFGADILAISRHGGWADNSPVVFRYIRDVDMWERNPMRLIDAAMAAAT